MANELGGEGGNSSAYFQISGLPGLYRFPAGFYVQLVGDDNVYSVTRLDSFVSSGLSGNQMFQIAKIWPPHNPNTPTPPLRDVQEYRLSSADIPDEINPYMEDDDGAAPQPEGRDFQDATGQQAGGSFSEPDEPEPAPETGASTGGGAAASGVSDPFADLGEIGPDSTDQEVEDYIRDNMGLYSWMLDIPELRDTIFEALRNNWTEDRLRISIQSTEWWKETEPQAREWQRRRAEDPAFARRLISDVALDIRLEAIRLGVNLTDEQFEQIAGEAIAIGAVDLSGNANGNLVTQMILSENRAERLRGEQDLSETGQLSQTGDQLVQLADNYLIQLSDQAADNWAERIALGEASAEQFEAYVKSLSAGRFPHLAKIIESGVSPANYFEPYRQQIARLLEVNPDDIDLFNDPRFNRVVEYSTADGVRSMTLQETQQMVRSMPEWESTYNGLTTAAATMESVLRVFGEG